MGSRSADGEQKKADWFSGWDLRTIVEPGLEPQIWKQSARRHRRPATACDRPAGAGEGGEAARVSAIGDRFAASATLDHRRTGRITADEAAVITSSALLDSSQCLSAASWDASFPNVLRILKSAPSTLRRPLPQGDACSPFKQSGARLCCHPVPTTGGDRNTMFRRGPPASLKPQPASLGPPPVYEWPPQRARREEPVSGGTLPQLMKNEWGTESSGCRIPSETAGPLKFRTAAAAGNRAPGVTGNTNRPRRSPHFC
ncbi:hypothetical protein AAFF_G00424020 [Aldrovandia affinis]|uniref:Uncharacterized protein n=1 Tax=Aldrovandia affinis TaxID=143900 RepID=A0AAD7WZY4_9TELE|nr:hypothetical protein AAFF_G00424020 [Aldrovandia affinis]